MKPTTGGGIYYSILSGALAADALDGALRRDELTERDLRPCEESWRARLGPDIRAGLAFRALATRIGDRGIQALIEVARVDGIVAAQRDGRLQLASPRGPRAAEASLRSQGRAQLHLELTCPPHH